MSRSRTTTVGSSGAMDLSRMRRSPTHPGEIFLKEFLEPLGYGAQARAARTMGMSTVRLNEVCTGKRPVTPETALLIAAATGTSAQMWLHLQADYDLWHLMQEFDTSKVERLTAKR